MAKLHEMVNAPNVASYVKEKASNKIPFLGKTLFPAKKKLGLDLSWIKGSKGLPVALQPSSFDTDANIRDRVGVSKIESEMPFFREGMKIGEKERQELNKLMEAGDQYLEPILNNIFDDIENLVTGADVQPERMIMQLLSSYKIEILANRKRYKYNYDPNGELAANNMETLLSTAMWSDLENATPLEDIERWQDTVEELTGVRPTRGTCTIKTLRYIVNNKNVIARFEKKPNKKQVLEYILDELNLTIQTYNKKFKDEKGVEKQYFPDDVFTLLPEGTLGNTWYGTTPEESDLMGGNSADGVEVEVINTGVAITSITIPHPVNTKTIVSEIVLPSFERIDETFVATVA